VAEPSTFGYARASDGAYLGYRVDGDGPIDVAWQGDWPGNIDMDWQDPLLGSWLREMRSFARVITHDHRGVGLSSRNVDLPTLETRVADLLAVLDSIGARRPALVGVFSTGAVNVMTAAMRPALPRAIAWLEPSARFGWAPDYPWGATDEDREAELGYLGLWGTDAYGRAFREEEEARGNLLPPGVPAFMAMQTRNACTPDVARGLSRIWFETDVRGLLDAVGTPTLLLVHKERKDSVDAAEYIASRMPAAEVREMPGDAWTAEEAPAWAEQIRDFIGAERPRASLTTILATVMFTDIVGSTEKQASLGDRSWKELIERHHALVRHALARHDGIENDTAGDGFYATFDGPARAIRCALEIGERVRELGIEIRSGIHTGECELIDNKVGGIAVTIGARVAALADRSEILVSQTVKDLVAGSGLSFEDRGEHELKGVPDRWHLYRVAGERT
jgi:class 3 adenylate cyclase